MTEKSAFDDIYIYIYIFVVLAAKTTETAVPSSSYMVLSPAQTQPVPALASSC